MSAFPRGASAVVAIEVEEPAARGRALGDPLRVDVRVHLNVRDIALEQGGVLHRPADDVDRDVGVGEVVVARGPLEPFGVLGGDGRVDLVALVFGDCGVGFPADAVVDGTIFSSMLVLCRFPSALARHDRVLPLGCHNLIPTIVLEAHRITRVIRLQGVIPNLLERRSQVRGRAPAGGRGLSAAEASVQRLLHASRHRAGRARQFGPYRSVGVVGGKVHGGDQGIGRAEEEERRGRTHDK